MWDLIVSVPDHCLSFYFTERTPFCDGKTDRQTDDNGKNNMSPDPEVVRHKTKPPNTQNMSLQLEHTRKGQHIYARDLRLSSTRFIVI